MANRSGFPRVPDAGNDWPVVPPVYSLNEWEQLRTYTHSYIKTEMAQWWDFEEEGEKELFESARYGVIKFVMSLRPQGTTP